MFASDRESNLDDFFDDDASRQRQEDGLVEEHRVRVEALEIERLRRRRVPESPAERKKMK
jgi:hypothetical protein